MKTDKSSTKRKLGEKLVNLALAKVDAWTIKELVNIGHNLDYPICLQVSEKEFEEYVKSKDFLFHKNFINRNFLIRDNDIFKSNLTFENNFEKYNHLKFLHF